MSFNIVALFSGVTSIFTPKASKTSAAPHLELAARFPCLATFTPLAAIIREDVVEILNEFEPSPPVPTISKTSLSFSSLIQCSRIPAALPVISSIVSPFKLKAVK